MEEQQRVPRRRVKKTKQQLFMENQLPLIIVAAAAILILIFLIGSISNAVKRAEIRKEDERLAAEQAAQEKEALDQQIAQILLEADLAATQYDYENAVALLDTVSQYAQDYPMISQQRDQYAQAADSMIVWNDPEKVVNLSFQMLIANPAQAFNHNIYGSAFNRNYITTGEFSAILTQLYDNGYVLVTPDDVFGTETTEDGNNVQVAKTLYLPAGKKPLTITQTNVNYNYYLVDSNDDKIPDENGCGFAHKLVIQNGKPINEMVDQSGQIVQGAYDLIPILEEFIAQHPDFSYRGSKAVVAVTGYDGLFGHRTAFTDQGRLGDAYQQEVDQAIAVAQWLQNNGYQLACYTYRNIPYGTTGTADIQADLDLWNQEVAPLIGTVDTLVLAQRSDISDTTAYSGERYDLLKNQGFTCYLGFCEDGRPWASVTDEYVRQGRIMVAGATLKHHGGWYTGILDPSVILDTTRGEIEPW